MRVRKGESFVAVAAFVAVVSGAKFVSSDLRFAGILEWSVVVFEFGCRKVSADPAAVVGSEGEISVEGVGMIVESSGEALLALFCLGCK